jgi:hypothetical protein
LDLSLVEHCEGEAALEPQLLKDIVQVTLHSLLADIQVMRDFLVA